MFSGSSDAVFLAGPSPPRAFSLRIKTEEESVLIRRQHRNSGKKAIWTLRHNTDRRPSVLPRRWELPAGKVTGKAGRALGSSLLHPGRDLVVPQLQCLRRWRRKQCLTQWAELCRRRAWSIFVFMSTSFPSVDFVSCFLCSFALWGRVEKQAVHFARSRWPVS